MEDLAAHFKMKAQDTIDRVTQLSEGGQLTGVMDDRGKFIYISQVNYCKLPFWNIAGINPSLGQTKVNLHHIFFRMSWNQLQNLSNNVGEFPLQNLPRIAIN